MTDKQALREEFQCMQNHYSDPADRERQVIYIAAEALLNELEASAKQNALDIQIKARLCRESNSLHDRLREAEKRIADQQGIILSARQFISEYAASGDAGADEFVKVIDRAAGIGKGE
ncbi:TPA: hypothetical protein ACX13S_003466 [Citrobacter koseri]